MDIVQAKRASTAAAIWIRSIRGLAKNTERLSVIQYDVSTIRNDTVETASMAQRDRNAHNNRRRG